MTLCRGKMISDIVMYLSISLFSSVDLSLCIYMCVSALSLSLNLKDYVFVLEATSRRLRGHPCQLLMVVALQKVKCGVMY
jgi:hypothetical protein